MKDQIWRRLDPTTRQTVQRSVIRLAAIVIFAQIGDDFLLGFWLFAFISAAICAVQAVRLGETPFGPRLNYWDELWVFVFLGHAAYMLAD